MDYCEQHIKIIEQHMKTIEDVATIKQVVTDMKESFDEIKVRMVAHINEGEREGGIRDQVRIIKGELDVLSQAVDSLKKAEWRRVVVAGVIGGIVSRSPDIWALGNHLIVAFLK